MKYLLILLISFSALPFKAVITALEAPLFKEQDSGGYVIQYFRKGDEIIIHRDDRFGDFYKTLTTTGDEAYILKEHVYVYYKDSRELDYLGPEFDNTDYRIPEPLPEKYPIKQPTGYRGQFYLSFGSFNSENYTYPEKVLDSSNDSFYSLNFLYAKGAKFDESKRFFFGALFNLYKSSSTFLFQDSKTTEENFKFGLGPYLSYDAWKNRKYMITLFSSLQVYLYDKLNIKRSAATDSEVEYSTISLNLKTGIYFSVQNVLADFDFISGLGANFNPPNEYESKSGGNDTYFQNSFKSRFNTQISIFLGIQSNY